MSAAAELKEQALATIDKTTGELTTAALELQQPLAVNPYQGASMQPVSEAQREILLEHVDPHDVEIKPDGMIYLPQTKYRRKLNQAFGPMGWSMIPRGELTMKGSTMYRPYALFVGGRFVSESIGSQQYFESNAGMNYADAAEGVKSNCIERCCKDLGIASQLWDPIFIAAWKKEYAVQVWAIVKGQRKQLWRRIDRDPLDGEGNQDQKPSQDAPQSTNSAQPVSVDGPKCPTCKGPMRLVPKGITKTGKNKGREHDAFYGCASKDCKGFMWARDYKPETVQEPELPTEGGEQGDPVWIGPEVDSGPVPF